MAEHRTTMCVCATRSSRLSNDSVNRQNSLEMWLYCAMLSLWMHAHEYWW